MSTNSVVFQTSLNISPINFTSRDEGASLTRKSCSFGSLRLGMVTLQKRL